MKTKWNLTCRALAAGTLLTPVIGLTQEHEHAEQHREIEEIVVTATPLQSSPLEMTQSATVLTGEALNRQVQGTIGETVSNVPGVQSGNFGPGVGRPIIRGLGGARVDVMENNISSNDVSNVSADHAVSIEPFLAESVEVLRGPATLLYGSDTIGGVVNVRTNRIHSQAVDGLNGSVQLQVDSVADERFGAARLDGGNGLWSFHADAFSRDTDDYEIPGRAELAGEADEDSRGVLDNSAVETRGGAVGVSRVGDDGYFGIVFSRYENDYGIPGHGEAHGEDHEDEEDHEEEESVSINLEQSKVDLEAARTAPFGPFEQLKLVLSSNDYEHVELEGEETGTRFLNDTLDSRLEALHQLGNWDGVVGLQYTDREFEAIGEEAFVPPSSTETLALFLLEETEVGDWRFELGGRLEDQDIRAVDGRRVSHEPLSLSSGAIWHFSEASHLSFNLSRVERAPAEEELLAFGPHIATQTFEVGDIELTEERMRSVEVGLRRHTGRFTGSVSVFHNDFSNFIYLADAGSVEDGLPVRVWSQEDARFEGFELEGEYLLADNETGLWSLRGFHDTVDAKLDSGGRLPRIAPSRLGLGLDWASERWRANLDLVRYDDQDEVAPFETRTDGYTQVNLNLAWHLDRASGAAWEVFLRGRNVTDEEARNHTSFLKDRAPLPGRNWVLGVRTWF